MLHAHEVETKKNLEWKMLKTIEGKVKTYLSTTVNAANAR